MPPSSSELSYGGEDVYEPNSTSRESSTISDSEKSQERLDKKMTCDAPCCSHGSGCSCKSCFCRCRPKWVDANRETYGGQGGFDHSAMQPDIGQDVVVNALNAQFASLDTASSCGSPAERNSRQAYHLSGSIATTPYHMLRQHHANINEEDRINAIIQHWWENLKSDSVSEDENPADWFTSAEGQDADSIYLSFQMGVDEGSASYRVNSNKANSRTISSQTWSLSINIPPGNMSGIVRNVGALFGSQYHIAPPNNFLPLVPECRHSPPCA